jgi:hypothetical protein
MVHKKTLQKQRYIDATQIVFLLPMLRLVRELEGEDVTADGVTWEGMSWSLQLHSRLQYLLSIAETSPQVAR